jgi:dihydrofolate reductase
MMVKVFIAVSLDGYIADHHGSVDFLYKYPEPEGEDMGYHHFISTIDALVMGRKTFETVLTFGVEWPYSRPVYVWTSELKDIPSSLKDKVYLINGTPASIVEELSSLNHINLYIDGGKTIQSFLNEDMVDEMIITTIPVLLGSGIPLFSNTNKPLYFNCIESRSFSHGVTQSRYKRDKV